MPELNRRAFLASIVAALALKEPVCAWCKGTGSRDYNHWDPVRFVTYVYQAECDACGERALWLPGRKLISIPAPRVVRPMFVVSDEFLARTSPTLFNPRVPYPGRLGRAFAF